MARPIQQIFEFDGYRLDVAQRQLKLGEELVPLTPKAFDVLVLLVRHNGRVLDKDDLMKQLWPDTFVEEANLNVQISMLRKALGESANNSRYISTIPGRGYRFNAELGEMSCETTDIIVREKTTSRVVLAEEIGDGVEATGVATGAKALQAAVRRPGYVPILVACFVALLVVLGSVLFFKRPASGGDGAAGSGLAVESLAVVPFKSLGGQDEDVGLGIADTLITRLSGLGLLNVRPTSAVLRYVANDKDSVTVGRELGVDSVLEGSIQREGERLRVTVRLTNVRDRSTLWTGQFDEQFTGILDVQDAISQKVTESLALKLSEEQRKSLVKRHTNNIEAYHLYLKGRHFWNKRTADGLKRASEFFQRAIDEDPTFALAYAGLADVYSMLGEHTGFSPKEYRPQARAAAMKALELDDALAEAHASLGYLKMRDWEWAGVENEFKRALDLDPHYATAHQWYSTFLELTGRSDEAIAAALRAQELDPLSLIINESLGSRLYFARQYDRALTQLRKTVEIDQNFAPAHHTLGATYLQLGMTNEALKELERARQLDNNAWVVASLGHAYALSGRSGEALKLLAELKERSRQARLPPEEVARVYVGLGDRAQALAWLERAYEEHSDHLAFAQVDPAFESLRSDPRFVKIFQRVGLVATK
jgi:DNA-binding winged helix-turn-helix (wHTH) protein/TolB-like protein/Tfp pilus assembly protein PilF